MDSGLVGALRSAGIEAVAFDLDGTLLDSDPAEAAAFQEMWQFVTGEPCPNARLGVYLAELEEISLAWDEGRIGAESLGGPAIRQAALKAGLKADPAQLPALEEIYLKVAVAHGHLFPEVPACLEQLAGQLPMAILTNGPGPLQRRKVERHGLDGSMTAILISGETGLAKPDPAAFLELAKAIARPPQRIGFIGDSAGSDMLGAISVEMRAIWLNRCSETYPHRLARPWATAPDLTQALVALTRPA